MDQQGKQVGQDERSVLGIITSHWVSAIGAGLVTVAACTWFLLLVTKLGARESNPYVGILIFFVVPGVFFAGLALIPAGAYLARRRIAAGLAIAADRRTTLRRLALFVGLMTLVNLVIGSQLSYRAVAHMESNQFCGQSCHVMNPQFIAAERSEHRGADCVACHVVPGAVGFLKAKANGTNQMIEVVRDAYPKPLPAALTTNKLAPSAETCEQCHSRKAVSAPRVRVISHFKEDEANTRLETILVMKIGGGRMGGIHGAHMGPGVEIRYRSTDGRRLEIPWIEARNAKGQTETWLAEGAKDPGGTTVLMECADCHNRTGHAFELPENAVDAAMANGRILPGLPFSRKTSVQVLKGAYADGDDAARQIPEAFTDFYRQAYPKLATERRGNIEAAGKVLAEIYRNNVFVDLGVKWGSYPNNLSHADNTGCFRCHDGNHAPTGGTNRDPAAMSQDCNSCHQMLATDEGSPEILQTLGLTNREVK